MIADILGWDTLSGEEFDVEELEPGVWALRSIRERAGSGRTGTERAGSGRAGSVGTGAVRPGTIGAERKKPRTGSDRPAGDSPTTCEWVEQQEAAARQPTAAPSPPPIGPVEPLTRKWIVLDLDDTLIHSFVDDEDTTEGSDFQSLKLNTRPDCLDLRYRSYAVPVHDAGTRRGEGRKTIFWGIKRPYLQDFLTTCFSYFEGVAVWSAGQKEYVHEICNDIFRDLFPPHVVFTWDDCDHRKNKAEKPLASMISKYPDLMSLENTFVLDDRESTFADHNPENAILIPEFQPVATIHGLRSDDKCLRDLTSWLLRPEVIQAADVRKLDKTGIFADEDDAADVTDDGTGE